MKVLLLATVIFLLGCGRPVLKSRYQDCMERALAASADPNSAGSDEGGIFDHCDVYEEEAAEEADENYRWELPVMDSSTIEWRDWHPSDITYFIVE